MVYHSTLTRMRLILNKQRRDTMNHSAPCMTTMLFVIVATASISDASSRKTPWLYDTRTMTAGEGGI